MPTTIPLASPHLNCGLEADLTMRSSILDTLAIGAFTAAGILLSLAWTALFPISTHGAFLMASVS